MLRNTQILLKTDKSDTQLYSADLSKSTDPISIHTAQHVLRRVCSTLSDLPEWVDTVIEHAIGPQRIEANGKRLGTTTCGALMGLGPGWTVLTILNAFAAVRAGCSEDSFRVCGDDLIGLWTEEQIAGYNDNIKMLGLESNVKKSFKSATFGVFCEMLMRRTSEFTADSVTFLRIGEASATRAVDHDHGPACLDALLTKRTQLRPIAKCVQRTQSKLGLHKYPGLFREGGGGNRRPASATSAIAFLHHGPLSFIRRSPDPRLKCIRSRLIERRSTNGDTDVAEVLITAQRELLRSDMHHLLKKPTQPTIFPAKELETHLSRRYRDANKKIRSGVITHLKTVGPQIIADDPRYRTGDIRHLILLARHKNWPKFVKKIKRVRRRKIPVDKEIANEILLLSIDQFQVTSNVLLDPIL